MSFSRKIWDMLNAGQPHPAAPIPEDPEMPVVWADGDSEKWRLWSHPGSEMDTEDRALIWTQFQQSVDDVLLLALPEGVSVSVVPPHTFPNGKSVEGVVRFVYPPPESSLASEHWWEVITNKLPEVSALMNNRITRDWPAHLAQKRKKEPPYIKRARQRLAQVQAVADARARIAPQPGEKKKKGRSM